MRYSWVLGFFGLSDGAVNNRRGEHADMLFADASQRATDTRMHRGLMERLIPSACARWLDNRRAEMMLVDAMQRLQETSPHLLDDAGMDPLPTTATGARNKAHLVDTRVNWSADDATATGQQRRATAKVMPTKVRCDIEMAAE